MKRPVDSVPPARAPDEDEPPGLPGLSRWSHVYVLILVVFALLVVGLAWFTAHYR
jgi:hypothetical protein